MSSIFVVCEGFHDRAFLKGWLKSKGWSDDRSAGGPKDEYRFSHDGRGATLRLKPLRGGTRTKILRVARERWDASTPDDPVDQLVVCLDSDEATTSTDPVGATRQAFASQFADEQGVSLLCWHVPDVRPTPGLPSKHTLELVVCEAMRRVYPERLTPVASFLDAQPQAAQGSDGRVKEHAWAYMAKWYGDAGCDEFYQSIWRDPALRPALEEILSRLGTPAW